MKDNTISEIGDMTLDELFDNWIAEKRAYITEASYNRYCLFFKEFAYDRFGRSKVKEIARHDWEEFKKSILEHKTEGGYFLASSKIHSILDMFCEMFEYGSLAFGLIVPIEIETSANERDVDFFTDDEIEKMRAVVKPFDIFQLCVMLCLETGVTQTEIIGVTWGDIDTEGRLLKIHHAKDRLLQDRELPIPIWIAKQLEIMKQYNKSDDLILVDRYEDFGTFALNSRYRGFLKKARVSFRNMSVLRHTFVVNCLKNGVEVHELTKLLGYENVHLTYKKYGKQIKKIRAEKAL